MTSSEELSKELHENLAMVQDAMKANQYYLQCLHNLLRPPKSDLLYRELAGWHEKIGHACSVGEENLYTLEQLEMQYRKMIDIITCAFP